jgi:hypothetical protein
MTTQLRKDFCGKKMKSILFLAIFAFLLALPLTSAAHYIIGIVNNAKDSTPANEHTVVLWNPSIGIQDNQTDIIGVNGNSGTDNIYMIDCEMLNSACNVGDTMRVKVIDSGDSYISSEVSVAVTGAGYDLADNLTLNSPPNSSLIFPPDKNSSQSPVNFNCSALDLDENLKEITLYGNWGGGWHANETVSVTGDYTSIIFTKSLPEGRYDWNCLATDDFLLSRFAEKNYSLTVDITPPVITSVYANTSYLCGTSSYTRVNCTLTDALSGIGTVLIEALSPAASQNYTASLLSGDTYYADILLNTEGDWRFNCIANDSAGNPSNLTSPAILQVHSALPDLFIEPQEILFSNLNPIEFEQVKINATIHNTGCSNANNFLVGFFEGDPSQGIQIGNNQTASVSALSNTTAQVTWSAKIGKTNVFAMADVNSSIPEYNESNNKANTTMQVLAWQEFYGNASLERILSTSELKNLSSWQAFSGNIFVADTESSIDWFSLQAIGKNKSGDATANDFSDIDSLLGMSDFEDSVSNVFTLDGNTPRAYSNFTLDGRVIENVPVINSTNDSVFLTGVLWDTSDDKTDGEFGQADKEDLVFVSEINKGGLGAYGNCDYEIKIPAKLRQYKTIDTSNIYLYYQIE